MISELTKYIDRALNKHGQSVEDVREQLLKAGWKKPLVDSVLKGFIDRNNNADDNKPLPAGVRMTMKEVSESGWEDLQRKRDRYSMPIWLALLITISLICLGVLASMVFRYISWPQILVFVSASIFFAGWILFLGGADRLEGTRAAEWLLPGMMGRRRNKTNWHGGADPFGLEPSYSHMPASQIKVVAAGFIFLIIAGLAWFIIDSGTIRGDWSALKLHKSGDLIKMEKLPAHFVSEKSCQRWIKKTFFEPGVFTQGIYFCGLDCRDDDDGGDVVCKELSRANTP